MTAATAQAIAGTLVLIFFALLIIAMSIPRGKSYHRDLAKLTEQVARIAVRLECLQKEMKIEADANREFMAELMQEEEIYDDTEDDLR